MFCRFLFASLPARDHVLVQPPLRGAMRGFAAALDCLPLCCLTPPANHSFARWSVCPSDVLFASQYALEVEKETHSPSPTQAPEDARQVNVVPSRGHANFDRVPLPTVVAPRSPSWPSAPKAQRALVQRTWVSLRPSTPAWNFLWVVRCKLRLQASA